MRRASVVMVVAIGWYLLAPPEVRGPDAPLRHWTQFGAYDTAAACEAARAARLTELRGDWRAPWFKREDVKANTALTLQLFAAVCIASDDSRLR